MFVLGGSVKGGKVYGNWPGLAEEQLNEGRDLAVTTDFRRVLGEAAYRTLGSKDLATVFPGAASPDQPTSLISCEDSVTLSMRQLKSAKLCAEYLFSQSLP